MRPEVPQESRPAVVLAGLGDGLVLRGELTDRPPPILLDRDRLVRRQLRSDVLEHPVEHAPRGRVGVVGRVRGDMSIVGCVGGDVGMVPVPAPGHRDVEVLPRRRRRYHRVRGIDRDPLGAMPGDRVAEVPQTHSPVIVRVCAVPVYRRVLARWTSW